MNLEYVDQSPDELTLNLFEKEFDKEELMVIKTKKIKFGEFDIEIAIIGASHYIEIKRDNELLFAEVFACISLELSNITITPSKEIKNSTYLLSDNFNGIEYDFEYHEILMHDSSSKEKILRFNTENLLEYDFSSNPIEQAVTSLMLNINNKELIFESLHAYPNHNKAIITKSSINLALANQK